MLISHLLCLVIVLLTSMPALQSPRLEADDYRYIHHIRQVEAGRMDLAEATVVENRWDHLWFMQEEGKVRFFRPTVIASYALDLKAWGGRYPLGLTVSNVWIHLLCCWLVGFILHRVIGAGWAAVGGAVIFASLAAHSECIWYIAGRTDSLAALGFLSAWALHLSGRRWSALPFFVFGLVTKELVIVAPVIFAAYDGWINRRRPDGKLYSAYGAAALLVLAIKHIALGGAGSDFVYPYLISPLRPEFPQHLWLQLRSYAGNLMAAEVTVPFADAATVSAIHHPVFPILGILLLLLVVWSFRKDRRLWLLLLAGFLTWLPTSFVYLSERYLYLPSAAFAGLLALAFSRDSKGWKSWSVGLLFIFALFQASRLYRRHHAIAGQPGSVAEMIRQVEPVRPELDGADRLLLVNLPGQFVRAQFVQDIFRVVLNDPELEVTVLTMMPGQNGTLWKPGDAYPVMGAGVQVQAAKPDRLLLTGRVVGIGQPPHTVQEPGLKAFAWVPLDAGTSRTDLFTIEVLGGTPAGATGLDFNFFQPLENAAVLIWRADCIDLNAHPWDRRAGAEVSVQRF
ncbi:hypothetical protein [Pontiella sp.]|uniref:hypothetical protein n=1 Tax=Pontiella sp. TaxID=2837462 RepID=UPI003568B3B5